jgi:2-keto-4-pentenoate hydratase/2-oxohepta-3-ene-1,7-dioic acid hydratase in catechol pathway
MAPSPAFPSKIVGIGRSYREHALELGNPVPEAPLVFLKAPSSLLEPGGTVILPEESERVDFEGEFALVVGERLSGVEPEEALAGIAGVTLACDVTARDLQKRDRTFARAKSFDTFCPLGPKLVTDPEWDALELVTRVNDTERQRGRSIDLIWSLGELVSYVSRCMTLEPGDLVLTGTPAGVGPLAPGDRVEVSSAQIGSLQFNVGAATAGEG